MKTGIICFWDRYATPYLSKYERVLRQQGVEYDVVFWNRLNDACESTITQDSNIIYINQYCRKGNAKVLSFLSWRKKCIQILERNKYDNLIVLTTVPAILLGTYILRHYKGRYIFDIRDYTLESNFMFRKMVMMLVQNSSLTPISSKGFLKWLEPSDKIIVNHNITVNDLLDFEAPYFVENRPINFSFVGNVRLDTQTRAMLITMGKSKHIVQHYYGRVLQTCDIEYLIQNYGLTNVCIHGPFSCEDKNEIYRNTDLINTVYANSLKDDEIPLGDSTPLPNRLYDALVFYRPLVTSKGTYLAELAQEYNLGVNVNGFDINVEQQILDYIHDFDREKFKAGCDKLRKDINLEEERFIEQIKKIFNNWR